MCGIIAGFNFDGKSPINEEILYQFEDQYSRGREGFGFITVNKKGKYKVHRATEPVKMMMDLKFNESPFIVFHHRMPTSSKNRIRQTHPILVDNKELKYKYLLIHNGTVSNDDELKLKHEEMGYGYTTFDKDRDEFNDSECLAIEVSRFVEGKSDKIDIASYLAFVAVKIDKETDKVVELIYGKNNNGSLKVNRSKGQLFISSEGKGTDIVDGVIYRFTLKTQKTKTMEAKYKTYQYSSSDDKTYWNSWGNRDRTAPKDKEEVKDWGNKVNSELIDLTKDEPNETVLGFKGNYDQIDDEDFLEETMKYEVNFAFKMSDFGEKIGELKDKLIDPDKCFDIDIQEEVDNIAEELINIIKECQIKLADSQQEFLLSKKEDSLLLDAKK